MKKIISALISICLLITLFAGCGSKKKNSNLDTLLYNYSDITKYVTLGDYKNIKIDTSSGKFASYMEDAKKALFENSELAGERELTADDTVQNGDALTIDYSGKMDGVVFDGGTAQDQPLTIGSGQMIPGFEEGIIGAKLGEKIAVKVTFPDPYPSNPDFSGKPAVFDITVKSGTRTEYPDITADIAKQLGYSSQTKMEERIKKDAVNNYICDIISDKSKVKSYPEKEVNYYVDLAEEYYAQMCESYQMTFEDFLANQNITKNDFEAQMKESLKPTIKLQLVCYAIAQKENLTVTDKEKDDFIKKTAIENNITTDEVKSNYADSEIEFNAIMDNVLNYLSSNAKIK